MLALIVCCASVVAGADAPLPPDASSPLHRLVPETPAQLRDLFRYRAEPLPLVSAHRGGAWDGYPENCLATFEHALRHTYALLEVDPRMTADGQIVLHHDATLERTTTGTGRLVDHTLAELQTLRLKDLHGQATEERMPTLDEALEWARGRTILVLDQKDVPLAERVGKVTEHRAEAFTLLIVGNFKDVQTCHALNPEIMMEVMIPDREKVRDFDALGIPWSHVVPFVGHTPPDDEELYRELHARGASCLIGTSRNLDRGIVSRAVADIRSLEPEYRRFLARGADLIETDIPAHLGPLLYSGVPVPADLQHCFMRE